MTSLLDRLLGRPDPPARKAVSGGAAAVAWANDTPLTSLLNADPKERMAKYLAAYKVGWFYKAARKISTDVGGLEPVLAYEDVEGDNEDDIVSPASSIPFDALTPVEQFMRLMERPNEKQTGRALRAQTQIRVDFAGAAFWYLENGDGGQLPSAIYGISPTRMDPALDRAGNLIGWVMDKGVRGQPGIPFSSDEILLFSSTAADDAWYGVSVVEAVYSQVPLTDLIARHTADVLTMGGRLAGMAWPKDRSLDETEFAEAQRAWRNVASDPNAARRLLLFPEPMEYSAGASSPKDIGIPELAKLNREEITTAFPVNPYMLGLPLEPGMNSGESLRYVQKDYWANTIHDRGELLEETIQVGLVPRYEQVVGRPLDFDLEEPQLDTAVEIVEKAGAMQALVSLGFDAKDVVDKVGLDHIKWTGLPRAADPNVIAGETGPGGTANPSSGSGAQASTNAAEGPDVIVNDSSRTDTVSTRQTVAKSVKARRDEVVGETLPGFIPELDRFLREQRDRLVANVEREFGGLTKSQRKAMPEGWWDKAAEDAALAESLRVMYIRLGRSALQVAADELDRIVTNAQVKRVTAAMLASGAERIGGINEVTREAARKTLAIGVQRGYSLYQLINGVAAEGFTGLRDLIDPDTGKAAFDNYRAELIARTETMRAYNESALRGYMELGVEDVIASDGDFDTECEERDGMPFAIEEALTIEDHPNGTLDWIPVVPQKAVGIAVPRKEGDEEDKYLALAAKAIDALAAQPVINVTPAPVTVNVPDTQVTYVPGDAIDRLGATLGVVVESNERVIAKLDEIKAMPVPVVNVPAPVVNVEPAPVIVTSAAKGSGVQDVRIVESALPPKKRRVSRDIHGRITDITEE